MKKIMLLAVCLIVTGNNLLGSEPSLTSNQQLRLQFYEAAHTNNIPLLDQILSAFNDPTDRSIFVNQPVHESNWTALHESAWKGFDSIAQKLLEAGADANAITYNNNTPLIIASKEGHPGIVKLLLQYRANLDHQIGGARYGHGFATALHHAALGGYAGIAAMLLAAGANKWITANCKQTPLHDAAFLGGEAVVHTLLASFDNPEERVKYVNTGDLCNGTALHGAARSGDCATIIALLDGGAQIDAVEHYNKTPLRIAVDHLKGAAVALLIARGANPLIRCKEHSYSSGTPLRSLIWNIDLRRVQKDEQEIIAILTKASIRFKQSNCLYCNNKLNVHDKVRLLPCGHLIGHVRCIPLPYELTSCPQCDYKFEQYQDEADFELTDDLQEFIKA